VALTHWVRVSKTTAAPPRVGHDSGETFFARNQLNGLEFAGPTFSPNKKALFVNIYNPGNVFAVMGPWRKH
jgi:secreted PhoX family phosphatase